MQALENAGEASRPSQKWRLTSGRHAPGKISGITGTAELYEGKPEIKVVDEAIKGADSQPVAE